MSMENLGSKPVNKEEFEMGAEKSLDEKAAQTADIIRAYGEIIIKADTENRAGAWKFLERLGLDRGAVKEMDKATIVPILSKLEGLLKPLGEATPSTSEETQALLERLDSPSFQEKLRESLETE